MLNFLNKDITAKPLPSQYGLPHDEWRPGQYEIVQWLEGSVGGAKILELTTGGGKTGIVTSLAKNRRVLSLVQTKLLQQANYGDIYKWNVLFGKSNYKCAHPDASNDATAEECLFAVEGMSKCPHVGECEYMLKKHSAIMSNKASLNYAYYLPSRWPKEVKFDVLVMDEAHMLSDITLDWAGVSIHEKTRETWDLPTFPIISENESVSIFSKQTPPHEKALSWINRSMRILEMRHLDLAMTSDKTEKQMKALNQCNNLMRELESTFQALSESHHQWYISSGGRQIYYRGDTIPGIVARPLTARYHFPKLFLNNSMSVMMSATIGNIEAFTEELGIEEYDNKSIPSIWPPNTRPIYDLGAPRLSRKSTEIEYEKQADVIARGIKECPGDWMGVIHVTRKDEAPQLANRLAKRGLAGRFWIPPNKGTNLQMEAWEQHKMRYRHRGPIAISWSWFEGVDLFDEKICISAKVPYPSLGDPFESMRAGAYKGFWLQRTAWRLMQSLGRTRRGEAEHYDTNGGKNGFVAIADGNWTRIKKYISNDILIAIVKN